MTPRILEVGWRQLACRSVAVARQLRPVWSRRIEFAVSTGPASAPQARRADTGQVDRPVRGALASTATPVLEDPIIFVMTFGRDRVASLAKTQLSLSRLAEGESCVIYLRHSVCRPSQLSQDRYLERPVLSRWVLEMGAVALCDTGRELLVSRSHSGMTVVDRRAVLALMCGIRFEPASPRLIDLPQINGLDADLVRPIYLRRPRNPLIADSPAIGTDSPVVLRQSI